MTDLHKLANIHRSIADSVPAIARGLVWCHECGRQLKVDGAKCLASGWPKCCGNTMSLDKPAKPGCEQFPPEATKNG